VFERGDAERQRRQLLAELIVHLARDTTPLVLLREDETGEEFGACAFGFRTFTFGQIEVCADDPDDRPPRLTSNRIAA
jgi:hypothetical protein